MSGRFFHQQLTALGKGYHAIALDMRGHGQSSRTHHGHTMSTYARDVHDFIASKGLSDVILAGWSMGCFVVWEYFRQFGADNVKGAIFIDEGASDFRWPDWQLGVIDLAMLAHVMESLQTDWNQFLTGFLPGMFKESPPDEDLQWMLEETSRVPPSIASAAFFNQTMQDYRLDLDKVTVPSLLVFGDAEGKVVPLAAGEHLRDNMPDARLLVFENSNHCPFFEEPARFNQEVDAFIQSLDDCS